MAISGVVSATTPPWAVLLNFFGKGNVTGDVLQSVLLDGGKYWSNKDTRIQGRDMETIFSGDTFVSFHTLENRSPVDQSVILSTEYATEIPDGAITTTYLKGMKGNDIEVQSNHSCDQRSEDEDCFKSEPETLTVDDVAFDAQSNPVTIEGEISALTLGTGWPNTAYVEIGVRPEDTMYERNAGVYMIFFSEGDTFQAHLQDYTGQKTDGQIITAIEKAKGPYTYKITLTPNPNIGGNATLEIEDNEGTSYGPVTSKYGYASIWQESVAGERNEKFSNAHLFYSIIADRRGVAGETYKTKVGDVNTDKDLGVEITIPAEKTIDFVMSSKTAGYMVGEKCTVTVVVKPVK